MLRAGVDLAEALQARYAGDFNHEPRDRLLKLKLRTDDALFSHSASGDTGAGVSPAEIPAEPSASENPSEPTLSTITPDFLENQVTTGSWEKQSAAQASATFRLFAEICGDRPLKAYTRKDAGLFKDTLHRLPSDYGPAAAFGDSARGKSSKQTRPDL